MIQSSGVTQSSLEDRNFHHVVVTVSGTQVNIYLDGDNRATRSDNSHLHTALTQCVFLGH